MKNCSLLLMSGVLLAAISWSLMEAILLRRERSRTACLRLQVAELQQQAGRRVEAERRYLSRIRLLQRRAEALGKSLSALQRRYLSLIRRGYSGLGHLSEIRLSAEDLLKAVAEILRESGVDPRHASSLPVFVDRALDNAVRDLRADIPGFGEEDILLYCYLVVGYDAALIAKLMGIDSLNTAYSRKKRLLDRIRRLPAEKANRYLALIP